MTQIKKLKYIHQTTSPSILIGIHPNNTLSMLACSLLKVDPWTWDLIIQNLSCTSLSKTLTISSFASEVAFTNKLSTIDQNPPISISLGIIIATFSAKRQLSCTPKFYLSLIVTSKELIKPMQYTISLMKSLWTSKTEHLLHEDNTKKLPKFLVISSLTIYLAVLNHQQYW